MSGLVLVETGGGIGTLTLHRPQEYNCLVPELLLDLLAALDELARLPGLNALVLQADGPSFSSGSDLPAFYEHRSDIIGYAAELVGLLNRAILALVDQPQPVVAAVHGPVTGGSLGLVLACDLVLVAPEAIFGAYYGVVGFSPDGGWTAMLPAIIGARRASESLLTTRQITAEEAVTWGLANRLVPAEHIRDEAHVVAEAIGGLLGGSIRRSKRLLWGDADVLSELLEAERQEFVAQVATAEAQARIAAFLGH